MSKIEGFGKGIAVVASAALGLAATSASAEIVSFTKVFTNTTNQTQEFFFEKTVPLTTSTGTLQGIGKVTMAVSDLRGDGAFLASSQGVAIYTAFFQSSAEGAFLPMDMQTLARPPIEGTYLLTSPARSNIGTTESFESVAASPTDAAIGDLVGIRIRFLLSAGDQATISGNFIVVPVSGSLPLLALAGIIGTNRRRTW
jgi:hypothetical protein